MTKKEFIEKYKLFNTHVKGYFLDGNVEKSRTIYANNYGELFVFYNNDLRTFKLFRTNEDKLAAIVSGGILAIEGKIVAGYSWYK